MILLTQVSLEGSPVVHRGSAHSSHAIKIGMQAWQDMCEGKGVMSSQQCDDSSGIADKIALVKLPRCPEGDAHGATCALILASDDDDAVGALYLYVYKTSQCVNTCKLSAIADDKAEAASSQA